MTGYYRKFIKNDSNLARALTELTKDSVKFAWTKSQQSAWTELKDKLCSYPILSIPNPELEYRVYTDASDTATGYVLAQVGKDKLEYVIRYGSRVLNDA